MHLKPPQEVITAHAVTGRRHLEPLKQMCKARFNVALESVEDICTAHEATGLRRAKPLQEICTARWCCI